MTQQNAANAEEIAASSEELNAQAVAMQEIVRTLQTLVKGEGSAMATASPSQGLPRAGVRTLVGAVVDAVAEVSQIPSTDIEPPPEMGERAETSCIRGMAKVRDKVVILLGIDKVLGSALRGISQAA